MSQSASVTRPAEVEHEAPPPFDPDPELIAHLEGNARSLRGYRRKAEELRARPDEDIGRGAWPRRGAAAARAAPRSLSESLIEKSKRVLDPAEVEDR